MDNSYAHPLIVGFVSDLIFESKIEIITENLGYRVLWIEREDQVYSPELQSPLQQMVEQPFEEEVALLDLLTQWRPALIILDLGNEGIPWRKWLPLIKSSPATRRIPVISFGSHVQPEILKAAKNSVSEAVMARSRFVDGMPELIQKYARIPNKWAIDQACQMPLSEMALRGLEEFNQGKYFEAHESLETAWKEDGTEGRELYRAVLQVAVAYLQIERKNYAGAIKMFLRLRQWIEPMPALCRGVNIAQLRQDSQKAYEVLRTLGADHISEFDARLLKPVIYTTTIS